MLYIILICLSFLLGGCSATGLIDCQGFYTYVPSHFTPDEQVWIQNSAQRWNDWVGYRLVIVEAGDRPACTIRDGKTKDPSKVGQDHHPTEVIIIDKEHLVQINRLSQDVFEAIIMHEIGHSLGFDHRGEDGTALMAPAGALDFTDIDRIQCIELGICKTLNPPVKHD
jgi:hypothetical protein